MKRPKRLLFLGAGAAALMIGAVVSSDRPPMIVQPAPRAPARAAERTIAANSARPDSATVTDSSAEAPPALAAATASATLPEAAAVPDLAVVSPDEKAPAVDPEAREALFFVGADPQAEVYWLTAINDPTLPEEERQDLIEDLNQDGISDPAHPAPEDLPLIRSRLALIEEVGSEAMDQANARAFAEAYKDLLELAMLASQTPQP